MPPEASAAPTLAALLLVAHPDDDAIFAGALQRQAAGHRWTVVCMTHDAGSTRAREMRRWQDGLGTAPARVVFLGYADDPEDRRQGRCSLDEDAVVSSVRALDFRPDVVLTHNALGEYGHPHHRLVHRVAAQAYRATPKLLFGHGLADTDVVVACGDKWAAIEHAYRSQRSVVETLRRETETFAAHPRAPALAIAEQLLAESVSQPAGRYPGQK